MEVKRYEFSWIIWRTQSEQRSPSGRLTQAHILTRPSASICQNFLPADTQTLVYEIISGFHGSSAQQLSRYRCRLLSQFHLWQNAEVNHNTFRPLPSLYLTNRTLVCHLKTQFDCCAIAWNTCMTSVKHARACNCVVKNFLLPPIWTLESPWQHDGIATSWLCLDLRPAENCLWTCKLNYMKERYIIQT